MARRIEAKKAYVADTTRPVNVIGTAAGVGVRVVVGSAGSAGWAGSVADIAAAAAAFFFSASSRRRVLARYIDHTVSNNQLPQVIQSVAG